ncbi:MAG: hypothetical protein FWG12_03455 [Holophagaceae bacterium]|nr:hypothetical protein [Holophagaceae bacterium]
MRKQLISSFVGLLLVGMGTQASAQDKGWQGGIYLPHALESLEKWTKQPIWGLCVDGAYQLPISDSRSSFRLGLGVNWLPGKEGKFSPFINVPRTISLTGIQISADLLVPVGSTSFSLVGGLSLNTWMKSVSGKAGYAQNLWNGQYTDDGYPIIVTVPAGTRDNGVSGTVDNVFGKYGLRAGLEYALNEKITLSVLFQVAELGTDGEFLADENKITQTANADKQVVTSTIDTIYGKNAVNPSWIQFGVRYKF